MGTLDIDYNTPTMRWLQMALTIIEAWGSFPVIIDWSED